MSTHRYKDPFQEQFQKAREGVLAWVKYAIESADERLEELNRVADQYGLDDYEKHLFHLNIESRRAAKAVEARINHMSFIEMQEFLKHNPIPRKRQ